MTSLATAPLRVVLHVENADGAPESLRRRLAELGLRTGAQVRVLQRTAGGGRIVDVAGSRVALGRAVLEAVTVAAATAEPSGVAVS